MRILLALLLSFALREAVAQPADCPSAPPTGATLPLQLDLAGRPGVPPGVSGQAFVGVPMTAPGIACDDAAPPPRDILRGEPGDALRGAPSPDLLRGPGTPHVRVESQ